MKITPLNGRTLVVSITEEEKTSKVSKDGVTAAKEIELEDKFENTGTHMVKEVASTN